jgi:hypothetical protein
MGRLAKGFWGVGEGEESPPKSLFGRKRWRWSIRDYRRPLCGTAYQVGINYYLWDYNRKALPKIVPTREPRPDAPPVPGF